MATVSDSDYNIYRENNANKLATLKSPRIVDYIKYIF